jgi:hypothetical protein
VNALRTLILGETWALPIGVALLAVLSIAADQAGLGWWADAAGPLLLAWAIVLVLVSVWQSARP